MSFHVSTGREQRSVGGADTTILTVPSGFYVEVFGEQTLLVQAFSAFLRNLAEKQAGDLGEVLHHAEFVITTDPAVVESRGAIHDCETCRAGVQGALRMLRETPDRELIVGTLYWVGE